jgi:hypothetical protein
MYSNIDADWTFGQIIPVVLLIAPIVTIIGAFSDGKAKYTASYQSSVLRMTSRQEKPQCQQDRNDGQRSSEDRHRRSGTGELG